MEGRALFRAATSDYGHSLEGRVKCPLTLSIGCCILLVGTNGCDYLMQWPWNSVASCTVSAWFQAIDFQDACQWGELNSVTPPTDSSPHMICRYCHSSLCSCRKIKVEAFEFTFFRMHNLHKCLIKRVLSGLVCESYILCCLIPDLHVRRCI